MAKKKESTIVFPRHLYKQGGDLKWGLDKEYSKVYVKDEKDYAAAIKAGYMDNFSKAIFGKAKEVKKEEDIFEDDEIIEGDKLLGDDF